MSTAPEASGEPSRIEFPIVSEADVLRARRSVRELAQELGFGTTDLTIIATAVSEITRNIVNYATRGHISIEPAQDRGRAGVTVRARDEGPGIDDLDLAMQDGFSTGRSLGLGLPGARRLMDEFEIVSTVGEGTTVTMTKWRR